ncbi:MAG TPA: ROK family protein [Opitutaceae bacterium]|nr:ROK family protein [Opitutaceae bacterium]
MKILGIDIGGSALKGAPVDTKSGKLLAERFRIETPEAVSPKKMGQIVAEIAKHFRWKGPIGIGFPGVVQGGVALTAANLDKRFVKTDLGKLFGKAAGCPVHVLNDADAAGLAEMKFGAGSTHDGVVLLLTLGTGVGSALFYRGVLYPNSELGHLPMHGVDAEKLVAASIRTEQDLSWKHWGKKLDEYLGILEKVLWPELIILGGGISAKSDKFFKYLKRRTPIVAASFQNEAGIVGAAMAAADNLKK